MRKFTLVVEEQSGTIQLHDTVCAICGTANNSVETYAANFSLDAFNPTIFSARRLPDRIHYRMVRCLTCGLLRSDPVIDYEVLSDLYAHSTFEYSDEIADLRTTYGRYLDRLRGYGQDLTSLLEVGAGNGFLLDEALKRGYSYVRGVEPGAESIAKAPESVRSSIVCDMMRPGLFREGEFDAVCLFQVLDHLPDPVGVLNECLRVLRPGGVILCFNHNTGAISARLLRDKSPIIDIEHTYLYDLSTMKKLLTKSGFAILHVGAAFNTYSLRYLFRLLPLPGKLKERIVSFLTRSAVGRIRLLVPLGNLVAVAQKPERANA